MAIYDSYTKNTSSGYTPGAPIVLRDEQKEAVRKAKARFKGQKGRKFLWNAKMRFGKTLSALQLVKELDARRTLIVTHRPVVDANFREDFDKIFQDSADWIYASRSDNGGTGEIASLEKELSGNSEKHYVFFASMQYLCRSNLVNSKVNADDNALKHLILNNEWDLVVVDEAHEATTGDTLGGAVVKYLSGKKANVLHLSGTPFNLYYEFADSEIFTWDYIQEQTKKAKLKADGVPDCENPYITLPKMNIFTYDLKNLRGGIQVPDGAQFSPSEFFRTWSGNPKKDKAEMPEGAKGKFVHEEAVNNFLNLLCGGEDGGNNYPFSTEEYQENFNHTLWVVPGVKEAKALTELLRNHEIFGHGAFNIINVAGDGDGSDEERSNALDKVLNAIGEAPDQTSTITISCGRLTTGVTVAPWTAVFYLKGSDNTSAATYMQTIFRVQSAHVYKGKMKSECYVFDFAPDRSLRAVAETAKFYNLDAKQRAVASQASEDSDFAKLREFMSFCPVISLDGGEMKPFDEHRLFDQLNSIYIDRIISSGYTDNALFNKDAIMQMDPDALKVLDSLDAKDQINSKGKGKCNHKLNMADNGLNGRGGAPDSDPGDGSQSQPSGLTDEQKAERKAKREELEKRRAKLRDITIRIPLLIFGGEFNDDDDIKLENFTRKVKDESWREFMPKGISKDDFNKLKKGINASMFVKAGRQIRKMTRDADSMHVEERIAMIAKVHDWFNNPNKETVLTPWRVVNMHLSDCLGGYCFMNESFTGPNEIEVPTQDGSLFEFAETIQPRFVSRGDVTREVFGCDSERPIAKTSSGDSAAVLAKDGSLRPANVMGIKILEINSKTGLYPLYATYSLYRNRLQDFIDAGLVADRREDLSVEEEQVVWDDVLQNNLYVISNTDMAEGITRRTLYGFREVKGTHIKHEPIVEQAKTDIDALSLRLRSNLFWNGKNSSNTMLKFTAVIGNPPYQINDGSGATTDASNPIYHEFVRLSKMVSSNYVSLIIPSKWMIGGKPILKKFKDEMFEDKHLTQFFDFENGRYLFTSAYNDGGICYFLRNSDVSVDKLKYSYTNINGIRQYSTKTLKTEGIDIVVRDILQEPIITKVLKNSTCLSTIISKTKPFGIRKDLFNKPERYPFANPSVNKFNNSVLIFGVKGIKGGAKRTQAFINRDTVSKNKEWIDKYKIFFTTSYSANAATPPAHIESNPEEVCTETFIVIGPFELKDTMLNCSKYLNTTFLKALLFFGHGTMQVTADVFRFVPLQDFSAESDVPWDKSIEEIDEYLFDKYDLSYTERDFIRRMIKPMN